MHEDFFCLFAATDREGLSRGEAYFGMDRVEFQQGAGQIEIGDVLSEQGLYVGIVGVEVHSRDSLAVKENAYA